MEAYLYNSKKGIFDTLDKSLVIKLLKNSPSFADLVTSNKKFSLNSSLSYAELLEDLIKGCKKVGNKSNYIKKFTKGYSLWTGYFRYIIITELPIDQCKEALFNDETIFESYTYFESEGPYKEETTSVPGATKGEIAEAFCGSIVKVFEKVLSLHKINFYNPNVDSDTGITTITRLSNTWAEVKADILLYGEHLDMTYKNSLQLCKEFMEEVNRNNLKNIIKLSYNKYGPTVRMIKDNVSTIGKAENSLNLDAETKNILRKWVKCYYSTNTVKSQKEKDIISKL